MPFDTPSRAAVIRAPGVTAIDHNSAEGRAVLRAWLDSLPAIKPPVEHKKYASVTEALSAIDAEFEGTPYAKFFGRRA